jgi:WD40 repeat protein
LQTAELFYRDGTIISGDSLGMVKFWDSRTCTQLQSFQGHAADVLCLTISPVSRFYLSLELTLNTSTKPGRHDGLHIRRRSKSGPILLHKIFSIHIHIFINPPTPKSLDTILFQTSPLTRRARPLNLADLHAPSPFPQTSIPY